MFDVALAIIGYLVSNFFGKSQEGNLESGEILSVNSRIANCLHRIDSVDRERIAGTPKISEAGRIEWLLAKQDEPSVLQNPCC